MELVYGIIWGIYTLYSFSLFLFLSRERIQYRIRGRACIYTGVLDALYRKSPCKHERPSCRSCSRCPRTRRYRADPPRTYCQSRLARLSVSATEDRRRYLIAMVNVLLASCRCVRKIRRAQRFSRRFEFREYRYPRDHREAPI